MKLKILVPGLIVLVVGVLFILMPAVYGQVETGAGLAPGPSQKLYVVKVAPGNYSYLPLPLAQNEQLTVTIAAGPQAVDFFLMNGGNFSIWTEASTASTQVYPQSAFNVKNYTFDFVASGTAQTYYLVFDSRSTTLSTDVLVHSSLQDSSDSTAATVPAALVGVGAVLALVGVRFGGKKAEAPARVEENPKEVEPQPVSTGSTKCRYCGEALEEGSKFCLSCGRSQG